MTTEDTRVAVAERAARAGGDVAQAAFRTDLNVETKDGKTDMVTRADRESQRRVIELIKETYPDDAIVGEEADVLKEVPESGDVWIIDPIDGTNNYVRGVQLWATSVAAVRDGQAVAAVNVLPELGDSYVADENGVTRNGDPITVSEKTDPETFSVDPTFWWGFDRRDEYANACKAIVERFGDMRRYGSAQIVLSMVASGQLDAVLTNVYGNPWDTIAGVLMIRQAGGVVTDIHGERWTPRSEGIVASNGNAHELVLEAVNDIRPE